MSDDIADKIIEATGAQPGDTIQIVTPQFTRRAADGKVPTYPGDAALAALAGGSDAERRAMGLLPWNKAGDPEDGDRFGGGVLWLLPGDWYDYLPAGFDLVCISGGSEKFVRGETDDDIRFGCLAFGIVVGARPGWSPS